MFTSWILQWRAQPPLTAFLIAYLLQGAMYLGAASEITGVYGALRRYFKIGALIDTRPLQPHQQYREIGRSLCNCLLYAATSLIFLKGSSGVWPTTWPQGLMQIVGFLLLNDFCGYATHRLLHTRLFATFHRLHHRSQRVTAWSALSLHPVEALLNQLPYLLFFGILSLTGQPIGMGTVLLLQMILMIGAANSHSNYDPLANTQRFAQLQRQTFFHQRHHRFGRDNYGYMGPHWDRLFGTEYQAR